MRQGIRRMTKFRLLLGGLAAVIAGPAIAQSCMQPAERTAFEVRAMQSQLQVTALLCRDHGFPQFDSAYRAFVEKFQRDLSAPAREIQGHFRRAHRSNPRALDAYITELANAQQQDATRAGSHFCPLAAPLFSAAMAQSSASGLAELAVERNVLNIMEAPVCPAAAAPSRTTRPAARTRSAAATR
jgi:hypothetical protein